MNIILADDERLPRLGLKSMIEELFPNQHTFIEITNGEELLLYVEQQTPDVIFLDIHMPKLSGLEAFSQFYQKKYPCCYVNRLCRIFLCERSSKIRSN